MSRNSRKKKSTRKQSKMASLMIVIAIAFVCLVAIVKVNDLRVKSKELSDTEKTLQYEIEQANLEREQLVAQEQYMKTKKYIEDVAKDKFGLVYPDEIVIKPAE